MKKLIALSITCLGLSALGQSTNLNATMQTIFNGLSPAVQADTLVLLADYNKACRRSPEFAGVTTNVVSVETTGPGGIVTNTLTTVVTTNHVKMDLDVYLYKVLANEKISRVVQSQNDALRGELYFKVGTTTVNAWQN